MNEKMKLFFKGLIIGLGKIIPGVSGGILAISLGVYEAGLDAINHPIKNRKFLLIIGSGILISVVMISKIIDYSLSRYYLPTMLLFVGLIAGGLSSLFEKVKNNFNIINFMFMVGSFGLLVLISNLKVDAILESSSFIFFGIMGFIDAFTMVVPGVSGTAIMMLFGAYDSLIGALSNLTEISMIYKNLNILLPFFVGMFVGTILLVKLMSYLFQKYNVKMYFVIIGLAISSTIVLIFQVFDNGYSFNQVLVGLILFVIGYFLGNKLEEIS